MAKNYQKEFEKIVSGLSGEKPKLLLHVCCAPCASHSLTVAVKYFDVTVFYYNPNITSRAEYEERKAEVKRLLSEMPEAAGVKFSEGKWDTERFLQLAKGLEEEPEGGKRCKACYALRLAAAVQEAEEGGFDFVTTTLTISPQKSAETLNEIGFKLAKKTKVKWLPSDFKKNGGYAHSVELSKKYNLYRQNYCGCEYGKINQNKDFGGKI